jgi:hypothetical protein
MLRRRDSNDRLHRRLEIERGTRPAGAGDLHAGVQAAGDAGVWMLASESFAPIARATLILDRLLCPVTEALCE